MNSKQHIKLTADDSSWIEVYMLPKELRPSDEEMDTLWNLHPTELGKVQIYGKMVETPRWHQSYMKPYKFSGVQHDAIPLPTELTKYLEHVNTSSYTTMYGTETPFNMCLLNWYENGNHYIGFHSDDESEMIKTREGYSLVYSISFGQDRTFRLKPKVDRSDHYAKDISMPHGTVVVMGGLCQKTHRHSVVKVNGQKGQLLGRRINLTFRQFKEDVKKRKREDEEKDESNKRVKLVDNE